MPAGVFCRKCSGRHERPVGRNCKRGQVGNAVISDASVNRPSELDNASIASTSNQAPSADMGDRILNQITNIGDKFTSLEGRARMAEAALALRTTDPVALSTTSTVSDAHSNVATPNLNVVSHIVPTSEQVLLYKTRSMLDLWSFRMLNLHPAQVNLSFKEEGLRFP